jgi:hypothetical protein
VAEAGFTMSTWNSRDGSIFAGSAASAVATAVYAAGGLPTPCASIAAIAVRAASSTVRTSSIPAAASCARNPSIGSGPVTNTPRSGSSTCASTSSSMYAAASGNVISSSTSAAARSASAAPFVARASVASRYGVGSTATR